MKNKNSRKKILLLFIFIILILGAFFLCALALLLVPTISNRNPENAQKYENENNYSALSEPPWFYEEKAISDFNEERTENEKRGINYDEEFYKQILEGDTLLEEEISSIK